MEWYWYIIGLASVFIGSMLGGVVVSVLISKITDRRMNNLEQDIQSLDMKINSRLAVEAKAEQKEAMSAAMAQAAQIMQSDDPDKMKKVGALLASNPDIAFKLIKKLGISF